MNDNFYTTKLTLDIEVLTQFGPADAINMMHNIFNFPAIKSATITKAESDYVALSNKEVNHIALSNVPCKIKS